MPVPDAVTPCKGYDTCVDMECGKCYDPYLGTHTTCGKMSYFDCRISLPEMCRPLLCTDSDVGEVRNVQLSKSAQNLLLKAETLRKSLKSASVL